VRSLKFIPLTLGSVLMIQVTGAFAQSNEEDELALIYGDKSTVSIATGSQQSLRRAPAVASVITAEDIAAMGATDLDDVLETVPGMHVSRSAIAYEPLYVIRGVYSSANPQILMLQNGVPMTTMFTGSRGNIWGGYPLEHVARIEIIRGPGSALYGADAYSGVINIITKAAADTPGTQIGGRVGSFNAWDAWIQHGGQLGPVEVAAYLRIGSTDGSKELITADAQTARDKTFGTHASLAPGAINTGHDAVDANLDLAYEKWHFRSGYKLRDNVGTGAGIASALDPVGQAKSERITSDLSWADPQFAKDWGMGATVSYLQYLQRITTDLRLFPPGTLLPTGLFPDGMIGHPDTSERQIRLSAFATYTGVEDHSLRFGVGHDDLNLYDTATFKNYVFNPAGIPVPAGPVADYSDIQPFMLPQRRKITYYYAQDEWNFARDWALTVGMRHDKYSDFGGTTNPRVAIVWDASLDLTAKLLYGRAFRAPSFNEEYGINNPVNRGNPGLNPETICTVEAAFAWQMRKDAHLNLNIFHYGMKDIIRTVPNAVAGTGATFNNTGAQHGNGMELELVWDPLRNLRLSGNYSYQRSIDETTHQDAGYAPHNHLYSRADWRFASGWQVSPQINWVAERERAAGDARAPIPDYKTVDITLRTGDGKNQWDIAASVRNLFNADAREPSLAPGLALPNDLPLPRRNFFIQLQRSL
jgi:outer membrane receptor for ferrienterochelin and colicin